MTAVTYNFVEENRNHLERGATFSHETIWTKQNISNPDQYDPIDLTGYTAKMQVRSKVDDTVVVLELSTLNGKIILGGLNGKINLLVPYTDTENLPVGMYKYDLELKSPTNFVNRLIEGDFYIKGDITKGVL